MLLSSMFYIWNMIPKRQQFPEGVYDVTSYLIPCCFQGSCCLLGDMYCLVGLQCCRLVGAGGCLLGVLPTTGLCAAYYSGVPPSCEQTNSVKTLPLATPLAGGKYYFASLDRFCASVKVWRVCWLIRISSQSWCHHKCLKNGLKLLYYLALLNVITKYQRKLLCMCC